MALAVPFKNFLHLFLQSLFSSHSITIHSSTCPHFLFITKHENIHFQNETNVRLGTGQQEECIYLLFLFFTFLFFSIPVLEHEKKKYLRVSIFFAQTDTISLYEVMEVKYLIKINCTSLLRRSWWTARKNYRTEQIFCIFFFSIDERRKWIYKVAVSLSVDLKIYFRFWRATVGSISKEDDSVIVQRFYIYFTWHGNDLHERGFE